MKKNIQPITTPIGTISSFEVSDLYLKETTINYQRAFYDDKGRQLSAERGELSPADYAAWCASGVQDSNEGFIFSLEANARGLTVIPDPTPAPADAPAS